MTKRTDSINLSICIQEAELCLRIRREISSKFRIVNKFDIRVYVV